ncbi:hypothetical protein [Streptomyces sp. CA2R106]|uniref:hypothetical protein n=1 Tax=Streptomyces sp. CA2R106 TaxID=3120153 RepID=UPI0030087BD3
MEKRNAAGHSPEVVVPAARDVVTVPFRQGLEAVDLLRLSTGVGPVFHDHAADSLAFLVPLGTADGWDLPGSQCHRRGGGSTPCGGGWLVPPRTDGAVTDPAQLRQAMGAAARTIELVDGFAQPPAVS